LSGLSPERCTAHSYSVPTSTSQVEVGKGGSTCEVEVGMRIMGLDVGTKNIGLAVSDETCTIAQGKETVRRESDSQAVGKIRSIAGEYGVERIVVGLPVHMNGTVGERALDSRRFAELLERETGIPVILWDERLSTKEAEDIMIKADVSRKKRRKVIDKLAAQVILQNYLDSERTQNERIDK